RQLRLLGQFGDSHFELSAEFSHLAADRRLQPTGLADEAVRILKFRTGRGSGARRRSCAFCPRARLRVGLVGPAVRLSHPSPAKRRKAARPTGAPANSVIASSTHCQRYSAEALSAKRWYASVAPRSARMTMPLIFAIDVCAIAPSAKRCSRR